MSVISNNVASVSPLELALKVQFFNMNRQAKEYKAAGLADLGKICEDTAKNVEALRAFLFPKS